LKKKDGLNLLEGNLVKTIIKLGYPVALGALAQTLYDLADALWSPILPASGCSGFPQYIYWPSFSWVDRPI